jgi:uncharacterized membrane protein YsdA (DUF1294 family)
MDKAENRIWILRIIGLSISLILPILALLKLGQSIKPVYLFSWIIFISVLTIFFNWFDKRKSIRQEWRISERTLHLLEILGGWPAAFLSQRVFRHKISKVSYQIYFWIIVSINQLVAFDYLRDWAFVKAMFN